VGAIVDDLDAPEALADGERDSDGAAVTGLRVHDGVGDELGGDQPRGVAQLVGVEERRGKGAHDSYELCHAGERDGGDVHGRSLLRGLYGPWRSGLGGPAL